MKNSNNTEIKWDSCAVYISKNLNRLSIYFISAKRF